MKRSAALAGALGSFTILGARRARAFGENPANAAGAVVPEEQRAFNILEVYLFGGLSPYESFYAVEEHGLTEGTHWHLFSGEVQDAVAACGYVLPDVLEPFAHDETGSVVKLGPLVAPLRLRPDLLARMRIVNTAHDVLPHEGAIPLMMTGRTLGDPNLSGFGAHIQHHFSLIGGNTLPSAYVLLPSSQLQVSLARVALARGPHPATARPLAMQVSTGGNIQELLGRTVLGDAQSNYDALVQRRIEQFRARLRRPDMSNPLETPAFAQMEHAAAVAASSKQLQQLLQEEDFFSFGPADLCGASTTQETLGPSLRVAAHLLTHETHPARYACVVDGGFRQSVADAGGYDTHADAAAIQAENLGNVLTQLAAIINSPGENDPSKLDLDRTMIVISTEFGRTPHAEATGGRGHWPHAFPTMFLGGPIGTMSSSVGTSNGGIYGGVDANGKATLAAGPAEIRVAMLMALGIWPFENESFNVSDVAGAADEVTAAAQVRSALLGVSS